MPGLRAPFHHVRADRRSGAHRGETGRREGAVRPGQGGRRSAQGDEEQAGRLAELVEEKLRRKGPVVSSQEFGIEILALLRRLDEVAYLRFASVYKDFQELTDFERELGILLQKKEASAKRAAASSRSRTKT